MSRVSKLAALALLGALAALPASAGTSARSASAADVLRARITKLAKEHHVDSSALMTRQVTLRSVSAGGTKLDRVTLDEAIRRTLGRTPAPATRASAGLEGTPELVAGDVFEAMGYLCPQQADLGFTVHKSALVPSTPAVEPVFGLPIIAYESGGPLYHIRGLWPAGCGLGAHGAGFYVLGSNVDTATSGPYVPVPIELLPVQPPAPLPVKGIGLVTDNAIDFLGHIEAGLSILDFKLCTFGYCVGAGVLWGDGVAIFDNHPLLGVVQADFPDVP